MQRKVSNWLLVHAVSMILATWIAEILRDPMPLIVVVTISFGALIVSRRNDWMTIRPNGGYANHVTLARFILLIITMLFAQRLPTVWFLAGMITVMVADGIDGYLARKLGIVSEFGEIFDMEVDAFLALALCFILWTQHPGSWWLLIAGLLRYIFGTLYRILRWHHRKRPHMPETKVFAVIFFIALLVPWVMSWSIAQWIAGAGCAVVFYSFAREFVAVAGVK